MSLLLAHQFGLHFNSSGVVLSDAPVLALVLLLQVVGDQVAGVLLDRPTERKIAFNYFELKRKFVKIFNALKVETFNFGRSCIQWLSLCQIDQGFESCGVLILLGAWIFSLTFL